MVFPLTNTAFTSITPGSHSGSNCTSNPRSSSSGRYAGSWRDHRQDFVAEGVDVGMRFGSLPDSMAMAKRIASWPRVIIAAPSYLARTGTPTTPADLAAHSVIVAPSRLGRSWSFNKKGKTTLVTVNGRLVVTYNEVGIAAAVAGLGLVSMTIGAAKRELAEGALVRVLADWDMGEIELHAVFPAGRAAKPAARAFVDFLIAEFAND
jgi:DNA-binding transcriptional LysR family regulator